MSKAVRERGTTLVFTVIMLVVVGTITATVYEASLATSKLSSSRSRRGRLRGYAEHGVAEAYYQLWNVYLNSRSGTAKNYGDYATWLSSEVFPKSELQRLSTSTFTVLRANDGF